MVEEHGAEASRTNLRTMLSFDANLSNPIVARSTYERSQKTLSTAQKTLDISFGQPVLFDSGEVGGVDNA